MTPSSEQLRAAARVDVRLLQLPGRRSLAAAHSDTNRGDTNRGDTNRSASPDRMLVVVGIEDADGVVGWGECSALNAPTYTSEWAVDSFHRLSGWAQGGGRPDPSTFPMTSAAIEMAWLDLTLRAAGRSLASHLGASRTTVRAGGTIGLAPVAESVALAKDLVDDGYRKIKIKIDAGHVDDVAHELTHVFEHRNDDGIEIHVDANGSLDGSHLMALSGLTWHGVTVIEQPFPVDRPDLARELMLGSEAMVIADEAVTSTADAAALLGAQALRGIAIKPPRVGGVEKALELLQWCRDNAVGASLGGMLESGLGRHALAAFGALDGFTITGDLSPASQWLAEDPWPDIEMVGPNIVVPTTNGVAPLPDQNVLDRLTLERAEQINPALR